MIYNNYASIHSKSNNYKSNNYKTTNNKNSIIDLYTDEPYYKGEMYNQMKDGFGIYKYSGDCLYYGEWEQDKKQGTEYWYVHPKQHFHGILMIIFVRGIVPLEVAYMVKKNVRI